MPKSQDQHGRFIVSSNLPQKSNSVGQSQKGKEHHQPNCLSPTTSSLAKKQLEASPLVSETMQGYIYTPRSHYHRSNIIPRSSFFPEAPFEVEDNPRKEMAHKIVKEEPTSFRFPIKETNEETKMTKIPHSTLLNFNGLSKEDHDTSLFKFDVLCRSYDYAIDTQKLKLFFATLKGIALG
jgi:hypothetical protein